MGVNENEIQNHQSVQFVEWSQESELSFIQSLDIGIMPLDHSPWSQGKSGFKLIQYMSCGIPVIATPVGANLDIVDHGVNGLFADSDDDWHKSIKTLINNHNLRQKMGENGRAKVEKKFSLKVWGPFVSSIIRKTANNQIL